jgi:hypothetical protein
MEKFKSKGTRKWNQCPRCSNNPRPSRISTGSLINPRGKYLIEKRPTDVNTGILFDQKLPLKRLPARQLSYPLRPEPSYHQP